MPTSYTGRVVLIISCLVLALAVIFYPGKQLFDPHKTLLEKTNINPGIDMVGGVSLIYQIQIPPGTNTAGLVQQVMDSLKKRVDPDGVRNLVWRPEGDTRLEIQIPRSAGADQAEVIKKAFNDAQAALDAINIRQDAVIDAVEHLTGDARDKRLAQLAMDSASRQKLFKDLCATFDKISALNANPDKLSPALLAAKIEPLQEQYDQLKAQIENSNLTSRALQEALDQSASDKSELKAVGDASLTAYRQRFNDFPSAAKAEKDFEQKYKDFDAVKLAVSDATDLKRLLQGSGVLEFHILADNVTSSPADLTAMDARLQPGGRGPLPEPGDTIRWMEVDRPEEFDRPGALPETRVWNGRHYVPVLITPVASMNKDSAQKWGLDTAYQEADSNGAVGVGFKFDTAGGKLFGDLTTHWSQIAKAKSSGLLVARARLAIVLDNKVISAPTINEPILGGQGIITGDAEHGGFSRDELSYLISTLNAGSLPAQLSSEPISEQEVGATIGADNLKKGLVACGFGLIVVGVFLVCYYYVAGIVAFFAVLMNLLLILGVMVAFHATFTLPSIAGIVLTVGTAVDANVLIFERLREEQHRGLGLRMALRNSYDRAFSAIVDSNMTSLITSVFLYEFGSEEVKGFGLTLIIGILASLFTALFVTKTIFGILIDHFGLKTLGSLPLTLPKLDRALKPNWDWMGKAWIFYSFSIVMIAIGLTLFVVKVRAGEMMDIEFASGTSVQFQLNESMDIASVRKLIDAETQKQPQVLPSPSVVAVGTGDEAQLHYEVVTPNIDRPAVIKAVIEAMQGKLKIQEASKFDQFDATLAAAREKTVLPIKDANFAVDGFNPPAAAEHQGGVAIVLRNLNPPLSADEIMRRLNNNRQSASGEALGSIQYTVQAPGVDSKTPTNFAVVIGWDPDISFNADEAAWELGVANPLWNLTTESVNQQGSLEKETNFDPQVAGEMQRDAILALTFSIIVIMAYIWARFGNLKYGTATVIALLHDTVFTLAAMGFAHYIYAAWPNNFLEVEPFRINLTVVAGILTIMGYSMIDTIVVFDRIRENRGKYGHLDKEVINRAINETLSRTLLTAGTTIITVSFMYFLGGAGIHGFTFVLLVGILVGTYSSVAIAAPLLLWGSKRELANASQPVGSLQRAVIS
jgi:SecD/SecF fusion protein